MEKKKQDVTSRPGGTKGDEKSGKGVKRNETNDRLFRRLYCFFGRRVANAAFLRYESGTMGRTIRQRWILTERTYGQFVGTSFVFLSNRVSLFFCTECKHESYLVIRFLLFYKVHWR